MSRLIPLARRPSRKQCLNEWKQVSGADLQAIGVERLPRFGPPEGSRCAPDPPLKSTAGTDRRTLDDLPAGVTFIVGVSQRLRPACRSPVLKRRKIERLLGGGLSINQTAKKVRVGIGTVHRIKTAMADAA